MSVKLLEAFLLVAGFGGGWALGYLMGVDAYNNKVVTKVTKTGTEVTKWLHL